MHKPRKRKNVRRGRVLPANYHIRMSLPDICSAYAEALRARRLKKPPRVVALRILEEAAVRPRRELRPPLELRSGRLACLTVTLRLQLKILYLAGNRRRAVAKAAVLRIQPLTVDLNLLKRL